MTGLLQRAHRRTLVLAAAALLLITATAWPNVASAATIPAGSSPAAIAVNSATNKIYVLNSGSADVTVIYGATNSTATVGVGQAPVAIAVNSVTNKIYVLNSDSVTVIDGTTNLTSTIAAGASPSDIAVNPANGKIYVASFWNATVTVIDGTTYSATTVAVHGHPSGLAVNPQKNEVYVMCPDWGGGASSDPWGSYVDVLDGSTNAVTSVRVGYDIGGIAVNAITNKVYVSCLVARSGTGQATIYVIDGATKAVTATVAAGIGPNWPGPVAINPVTNKIYMPDARGDVSVMDGVTNAVTLVAGCVRQPSAIAVNTKTNRTYVVNGSPPPGVTVLDGVSNLGTIATGSGPDAVAVNSLTNKIYVANASSNDVTVIDGMTLPDPVPVVPGNDSTRTPVLVLIAGLNAKTGIFDPHGQGLGDPWSYLGATTDGQLTRLGVSKIMVVDTSTDVQSYPALDWSNVIDSQGSLDRNIYALITWLRQHNTSGDFSGHNIILVGHSYGGVIARSMLAAGRNLGFGLDDPVRKKIIGLIQLGSPNGGSRAAEAQNGEHHGWTGELARVFNNIFGDGASDATRQLTENTMEKWNRGHHGAVGVPVVRFGGSYLPDSLSAYSYTQVGRGAGIRELLDGVYEVMDHKDDDGLVSVDSLLNGNHTLSDWNDSMPTDSNLDFGGGWNQILPALAHAKGVPGEKLSPYWAGYNDEIVPQSASGAFLPYLVSAIQQMKDGAAHLRGSAKTSGKPRASADPASSAQICCELPDQTVPVSAGTSAHVTVALDSTTSISVSSAAGAPTVVVDGPDGAVLPCPSASDVSADGATTMLEVTPTTPGTYTFDITLPASMSGDATLSGVTSGGAQFALASGPSSYAGQPTTLTASFTSAASAPLTGAEVTGTAELAGQSDVPLTFRDDGTAGDATASDGIYTAQFTPPVAGRWTAEVQGVCPTAERAGALVFDVGDALATVTGPLTEATTPGPGSTLASFGVTVPLTVTAAGTYTVSGDLFDGSGAQVGAVALTADLTAGESTSLTATIDASQLSGIATGKLTVAPLRITRYTGGIDLQAGSGPGLTTSETYASTDFYAFSVSLDGPDANPSPTHAVHFTGTALNTASTVVSVEYTIDGGANWHSATPVDGAFDSHSEDFTIDLDLPDYVYGILVRQTGADGTQLPVADWAGKRFTIDTEAPAQVTDLGAVVSTEAGSSTALASWSPSEPALDTVSPVSYSVSVDGTQIGTTYDTQFEVAVPDEGSYTLAVTPVDGAGNQGPPQTTTFVLDETPPVTADNTAGAWHAAPFTLILTPSDGLSGMSGGQAQTQYSTDDGATWQTGTSLAFTARWKRGGGSGTYRVLVQSTDAAGNTETPHTVNVMIDNSSPTSSDDAPSTPQSSPFTVHIEGSDTYSGVAFIWYSLDAGIWTQVAYPGGAGVPVAVSGIGAHTLCYYAVDGAGNVQVGYHACTVTIAGAGASRRVRPHVRYRVSPHAWHRGERSRH